MRMRVKNELAINLSEVLADMECSELVALFSKRYDQAKAETASTLTPYFGVNLAFKPVTATVAASGVDLQKVFVGASRANQHIYLMTRAELLVRLGYLHFRHDRHHR